MRYSITVWLIHLLPVVLTASDLFKLMKLYLLKEHTALILCVFSTRRVLLPLINVPDYLQGYFVISLYVWLQVAPLENILRLSTQLTCTLL